MSLLFCSVTQKKMITVSFLGATGICVCLCLPIMFWYRLLVGTILTWIISVRFLVPIKKRQQEYGKCCMAVLLTAILIGGSLALFQKIIRSKLSILQMMGGTLLISVLLKKILQRFLLKKPSLVYEVILYMEGEKCHLKALLDTGNSLVEPISGKPVCIIGKHLFEENMVKEGIQKAFLPQKFRAIPYHSVGKASGIMSGYEMDCLIINTDQRQIVIDKPIIGISQQRVGSSDTYQMILQPKLLEGKM